MSHALGLLMASALIPSVVAYGIGLLIVRRLRLLAIVQIVGFIAAWCLSALLALFLAKQPNIASAQESVVLAAFVASAMVLLAITATGRRHTDGDKTEGGGTGADSKACPFCAERIRSAAIVCRYCNRSVVSPEQKSHPATQSAEPVLTDDELMLKFGISFDGAQYCFREYRYAKLADAVSYAELQNRKGRT